ncbi:inorganic diphosphatase [Nibribacter ruber]|uniref:inorganic diphosphatase n=1 Tax=Nibribacter ruber TaxID=2698458 RepID=A0A6P1P383_9BACT|nr:inorganic diphosphatase [Nibribacter ruber]QHL88841.1 inorganic diphosphatase [Nibribacter ruber]
MKYFFSFCLVLFMALSSCTTNYQDVPAFTETKQWQAVIVTPAGSTEPQRYDASQKKFLPQTEAGQPKKLDFLPSLGNEGFIPSTLVDSVKGRPAAPLPVLVLSNQLKQGTVLEILPMGVLVLERNGELYHLIVAIPARPSEQTISAHNYLDFSGRYPAVKTILQNWYLNVDRQQPTRLMGWKDEAFAEKLIQQWIQ